MAVGAFVLMILETKPVRPEATLAAISSAGADSPGRAIYDTDVPLQPTNWRNVVVHAARDEHGIAKRCHFIVRDGKVTATELWKRQAEGYHVSADAGGGWRDYNIDSIGICLVGDYSTRPPSDEEYSALISLVRQLRRAFRNIAPDHVLLLRDIDSRTDSPGAAFPGDDFNRRIRHFRHSDR